MEHPNDLRKLAEWYRGMAEVGHPDDSAWRRSFAHYLEQRAATLEKSRVEEAARASPAT